MLFFRIATRFAFCAVCLWSSVFALGADYIVVVSKATHSDSEWSKVVEELVAKHQAEVFVYERHISESLPVLRKTFPRYACFVATSKEASRQMVADVHRLTRTLDDDPYADVFWGILTGYDAANALAIAKEREPLVIKRVASGTELAMDRVTEGVWYCELKKNRMVRKSPGGEAKQSQGPSDTTQALAATLTEYKADLFVTSGHASERNWEIGFRYRNGEFQSLAGKLFGVDTMGNKIPILSANPKVYLPIGNCSMGHIDGPDAMALAFMNSAGVRQMMGYTVPTWYGYGGWGCLDYFVEQPGRYTFVEAFFANQHALIDRLETNFPDIARLDTTPGSMPPRDFTLSDAAKKAGFSIHAGLGLLHDRDVVALYGDPAWRATLAPGKLSYEQTLTEVALGVFALEIKPLLREKSFEPVNQNGSERGWRPFIHFFPQRLKDIEIISGQEFSPVITDNFVLVPNPKVCDVSKTYRVEFRATCVAPQPSSR
jgi:zinc protease